MTMTVVEYLVARDGVTTGKGLAFDYLLAGDGVYLAAESDPLERSRASRRLPLCAACHP